MKKRLIALISLSIIIVFGVAVYSVLGYTYVAKPGGFNPSPAYITCFSGFSNETVTAVHNACKTWNDASDSGPLVYRTVECHNNTVFPVSNQKNEITKSYAGIDNYLMQANYFNSCDASYIYECDININVSHNFGTAPQSYYTESAMTHEIGHLLGLDHSDNNNSVMFGSLLPGEIRTVLQPDEIYALHGIYN